MDKRDLYDSFGDMEQQMQQMLDKMAKLRADMTTVLEKNSELVIENEHLREHMVEIENELPKKTTSTTTLSKSRQNLEKLYDEGFHVCNQFYGKRRDDDESCVFCLEVIYGERERA
ncbi:DNA replication initiation control protein YabA [Lactiplantibacillus pentosus]|uniref:DNA replication initiation control protein YabA n=1 Tax=Lactiplantibacillus pentosus TaxID=1589 RepID=UPI001B0BE002|nr:DNA replication initiation control protein YabA [Lactiplantibacillus pentosus]GIP67970.1 DNA replication initiation control protein YabA [Lactiplantibacillus pentosus]